MNKEGFKNLRKNIILHIIVIKLYDILTSYPKYIFIFVSYIYPYIIDTAFKFLDTFKIILR